MSVVMKFGGTSVADAAAFENVARIVANERDAAPVVVVSAMSGVTDSLLAATNTASLENVFERHRAVAHELLDPSQATSFIDQLRDVADKIDALFQSPTEYKSLQDAIVSFGETLSSTLLAEVLNKNGIAARQVDSRRCIITDEEFTNAVPLMAETFAQSKSELIPVLESGVVPVLGGFIGSTKQGITTTLGRGGSDYTAALIGAALGVREIQIWTDVTGVLTADPRVVPEAQTIERLSYGEAAELAYFGAKVLHPKTIQPAIENSIPVRICNSRAPQEPGTLVGPETETSPRTIKAIAHKTGVTTVQISSARMLGAYGFLRKLFEVFDEHRTVVDVVTTSEVSVSLSLDDASALPAIVAELEQLGTVSVENGRAIICVVGEGLRRTPGIAARVFSTISDINVTLISQGAS
ncbi:MAG TPA: lysine-sensitive aspartokinase 3, partial [Pyrinomonadaceae bacterium]|nr:lysine-sensitive aspartokinase 3 [Pyrinomonadaceae bacterium]